MIKINLHPSRRDLAIFATLLPVFFGLLGALRWHAGSPRTAEALWLVGIAVSWMCLAVPSSRRWLYVGWMYALYPVAWTVSRLVLVAVYLLVATPIALTLRATGRDPMKRSFDKAAASYWVSRAPNRDRARYFRQF